MSKDDHRRVEIFIATASAALIEKQNQNALQALSAALSLESGNIQANWMLGNLLSDLGRFEESCAVFRRIIQLSPQSAEAYGNLGNAKFHLHQLDEAVQFLSRAIELNPTLVHSHINLGNALRTQGNIENAIAAYRKALELDPQSSLAALNLGKALVDLGRYEESSEAFLAAIRADFSNAEAHVFWGINELRFGHLENGWKEWEWRWKQPEFCPNRPRLNFPQWKGEDLNGKTILIHFEQGFGDTFQFLRYIPLLALRGGKVLLFCQTELRELAATIPGVSEIVLPGVPLGRCDFYCPLLSLPDVFRTTLDTIPPPLRLRVDDHRLQAWGRLKANPRQLHVGIVWAGSPANFNDRNRSIRLADLSSWAEVEGVTFYSLQKGPAATESAAPPVGMELVDLSLEIRDFSDTAAMIENLDLCICVDTAVAHLAGLLGKEVWILIPYVPDWRWLLDRTDSPWYPTARLFRQGAIGDWSKPIREIRDCLSRRVRTH